MVVCTSERAEPLLPRFYAGRDLLITGATGFMGKVLVERLLSTCPEVGRVFLLMRDKRGQAPDARLALLKHSEVFENVRARCPRQLDKLQVVPGDVALPNLGVGEDAIAQLREVSVVFHSAATVKFWEPLAAAVSHNVTSALSLMDLCDKLPSLQALVHVSTAFTNADRRHIEERVYPPPTKLAHLLALLNALPQDLLQEITPRYISPKPNTYVFTKSLAEAAVEQRQDRHYAVAIFRPSIVVSSYRAPFPGWMEGLSGASGVVVGISQGLLRVFHIDQDARADMVPVDIAIDHMLAVAWETATDKLTECRVYYCGSQENPLPWRKFRSALHKYALEHPFNDALYYPYALAIRNKYLYYILEVLIQTVPLYTTEYIFKIFGIKTKASLITASKRLSAMSRVLSFFACQEWSFGVDNIRALRARLHDTDSHLYQLDITHVDWEQHAREYVRGARRYLMRQDDASQPAARARIDRFRLINYGILLLVALLLVNVFMSYAYGTSTSII